MKGKGRVTPGRGKREREAAMRRGVGAHRQRPGAERRPSIAPPGPRRCSGTAISGHPLLQLPLWPRQHPVLAPAALSPTGGKGTSRGTPPIHLSGLLPSFQIQLSEEETELFWLSPSLLAKPLSMAHGSLLPAFRDHWKFPWRTKGRCSRRETLPILRARSQLHCCLSVAIKHAAVS